MAEEIFLVMLLETGHMIIMQKTSFNGASKTIAKLLEYLQDVDWGSLGSR